MSAPTCRNCGNPIEPERVARNRGRPPEYCLPCRAQIDAEIKRQANQRAREKRQKRRK